jgi:hypothetical protein
LSAKQLDVAFGHMPEALQNLTTVLAQIELQVTIRFH